MQNNLQMKVTLDWLKQYVDFNWLPWGIDRPGNPLGLHNRFPNRILLP